MKRIIRFALAAVLCCGAGLFTACTEERDNPVAPTEDDAAVANRKMLVSHIETDARLMAERFSTESFTATSQAYAQLLALIRLDRNFISNMKTVLTAIADSKVSVSPVVVGSELAQMGYLAYITVDNGGFGARVIFDGKGNSRLVAADNLEFIFPAKVDGIGTTLFKLIIKNSDDYYLAVSDANIKNMKRLACINRLPRSLTMTLTGFIDNQEQTLSQSVVNLELPEKEKSEYVSFDAGSFSITGSQRAYLSADDESTLDYRLSVVDDMMTLGYDLDRNGASVVSCSALMKLPQTTGFSSQMAANAFDVADLKAFTINIVDDLLLTGTIDDGSSFAQYFTEVIKNRQQLGDADVLNAAAESLNESCNLLLTCEHASQPEAVKFCVVQQDDKYLIEPAFRQLDGNGLVPLSQLVDLQTMDAFNTPFSQSFTPAGNAAGSTLNFYSVFMQMMPFNQ